MRLIHTIECLFLHNCNIHFLLSAHQPLAETHNKNVSFIQLFTMAKQAVTEE